MGVINQVKDMFSFLYFENLSVAEEKQLFAAVNVGDVFNSGTTRRG